MSMLISQCQSSIAREVSEDDDDIIHGPDRQSLALVTRRRLKPTEQGGLRVLLPGLRLGTYYPWTLSVVDDFPPNRHICRIGNTYLARCLRLLSGHIRYAQTIPHIPHTPEADTSVFDEQQQVTTQDRWDFYNVYPQVMSILGEEVIERHESPETLPSRYCQEYVDDGHENTDAGSANDSGIDLGLLQPPGDLANAACGSSERAPHVRYRWSVDETIALHLLEAMESRKTDVQGGVNRIGKKKRVGRRLRQRIVTLLRDIRTRYLS